MTLTGTPGTIHHPGGVNTKVIQKKEAPGVTCKQFIVLT